MTARRQKPLDDLIGGLPQGSIARAKPARELSGAGEPTATRAGTLVHLMAA
jgi:hypothetical protein